MKQRKLSTPTRVVILAAFYFLGGLLGSKSSFMSGTFPLVLPASGIALAAVLLFGYRFWPGVAFGAALFSWYLDSSMALGFRPWIILGTAIGSTIGAVICAFLLDRFVNFITSMERVRDVAGFGFAWFLGTTVNAAFNVVGHVYSNEYPLEEMFRHLPESWVPNALAGLVITPVILTWGSRSSVQWKPKLIFEALLCGIGLILGTLASFNTWITYSVDSYPLAYLPYPFLVWGALRFGQRGAATGTVLVSSLAIYALLHKHGPFFVAPSEGNPLAEKESLMLIGSYIGILAVTNMLLAAAATERKVAEDAARKSEAMFLLISENVGDMIAVTDDEGKRLYNSPYYAKLLGDPNQIAGSNAFEQIHPEDKDRVRKVFRETIETGVGQRLEYRFLLRDGSVRYIESLGNYVRGEHGDLGKVVSIARDITDRKRDEESLRLLASSVRSADDSMVITTADLNSPGPQIVFVNPAFTKMTGYSAEEAIGKTPRILHGPNTDRGLLDKLRADLALGNTFHGEAINYRKDGSEFYNEWHIEPIKDEKGRTTHYIAIQRDITGRKQIESDLAKARDDALAAARLKAEFLANMSHEIRTPMNGVMGMTNLLLKTALNKQQREFAETIHSSGDSLLTLINDILDFSKIEAGKLTFETLDFDLRDAIEGTLELLCEKADSKGIELISSISPEVPVYLRGDPGRLRQVLMNLVGNAIKFTQHGEVLVHVSIQHDSDTHVALHIEIRDTGIGISSDAQARLFQPFSQADGSMARKYGGTGLGLAISKQLVEMMHGKVGVHSQLGKGSTFWFNVFLEKQLTNKPKSSPKPHGVSNLHVLVVDDNATGRESLRQQIATWDFRVETAANGGEALKKLRQAAVDGDPFSLALLDLQMPEMGGRVLAQKIKEDLLLAKTPLIMLTTVAERINVEDLKAAGVDDALIKPVRQSKLFDSIITVILGESAGARAAEPIKDSQSTDGPLPIRNIRILLAEDNTINQKVALGQLAELGYTADVVANGMEVIKALEQIPYDVVLMDCQMPEMDGYESSEVIRQRELKRPETIKSKSRVHIIAMTANAMQGDRERCLSRGMDDYITKPVEVEDLKAALDRWKPAATAEAAASVAGTAGAPAAKPIVAASPDLPAVDLRRLKKLTREDPEKICEMLELYLDQADKLIVELTKAVEDKSVHDIHFVAHKLGGSSANCGMMRIVPPLREMERQARDGEIGNAEPLCRQSEEELNLIRNFIVEYVSTAARG